VLWEVQDLVETLDLQEHVVMQVHLELMEPLVLEAKLDHRDNRVQ